MQTVILAAGEGTRMRPLTDALPKPMLPLLDRPLVEHIADAAVDAGASSLVFVVGYRGEAVRDHFGNDHRNVPVRYAIQDQQGGTADAVDAARVVLHDEPFVVLNGDVLLKGEDLRQLYEQAPAIAVAEVENPSRYGVLEVNPDGTQATGIVEKPADPPSNLANAGAYAFPASALELVSTVSESVRGERELTDVLDAICETNVVTPIRVSRWRDVGRPWDLLAATEDRLPEFATDTAGTISENATITGPVVIEEDAEIRGGVYLEGPILVRAGATVGPNAYIRGCTVIGPDATVGHAVEIKNSLLLSGATVGHQSYLGDSIIGPDANLGAGTNVANLRHDGESVRTTVKGEVVSTGRRKYGAVLGAGVKTGINTSVNAGVVLDTNTTTDPGEVVMRSRMDQDR